MSVCSLDKLASIDIPTARKSGIFCLPVVVYKEYFAQVSPPNHRRIFVWVMLRTFFKLPALPLLNQDI
ncbi:MAG: hypothetical protein EAZ78_19970 [Oscillatoriales cyanobacterium]|nr:MAG: hypothetical protein EA000_25655 [Oscillatoriales cyanobacterium]TAD96823.1 MAG: hypothetical protein EAZ98_11510 [Oscillatoriales cyanobacterium]TAE00321.1 MAG: hypothetical protein EAZ96_21415 [Oscillatoriales cyanobacterium]TAF00684.1 MAG: hypothetical protein EAZ78_19970 [Oscillatoriales cyanobacterium]TAF35840.1 MAG: hypothetical protein EAZ68_17960 [Oscillatoriales cyanobacterium]